MTTSNQQINNSSYYKLTKNFNLKKVLIPSSNVLEDKKNFSEIQNVIFEIPDQAVRDIKQNTFNKRINLDFKENRRKDFICQNKNKLDDSNKKLNRERIHNLELTLSNEGTIPHLTQQQTKYITSQNQYLKKICSKFDVI